MKTKVALASIVAAGLAGMSASLLCSPRRRRAIRRQTHHGERAPSVELQLINPHSIVVLDVDEGGGKVVRWREVKRAPPRS